MGTSSNSRDVKMTLGVETSGAEDIKSLQANVSALAKEGGDAAPEFQHLADEIGRLGEQAAALRVFQQLSAETGNLADKQSQAAATVTELKSKFEALAAVTQDAAARQQAAATALLDAKEAARAVRDELALLSANTDRAGKAEDEYTASVQKLKVAKVEQRAEVERLTAALAQSNAEVAQAESAQGKLAVALRGATASADGANTALQTNAAEVRQSADAAHALGVSTSNVAASQVQLVQGLNAAGDAAEQLRLRIAQLADTEAELAAQAAFAKQHEAARRLVQTSEYATLFDEALQRLKTTQDTLKTQGNDAAWQKEAAALVDAAESSKKLTQQATLLSAVEKELSAQSAFSKQAEDARKLVQSSEYVRFWKEELAKAEAQAQATAAAAQEASEKISGAFRTLGVRSAQELTAEIVQVRAAMDTVRNVSTSTGTSLNGAFAAGEAKIKALELELRTVTGTLTTADKAAALFSNSLGQIAAGNVIADGVGYLVNKVKELGAAFLQAIVQGDQMHRGLTAVYGSAEIAARQIEFLRKSSSDSGVAFGQLTGEFVKFSASMKSANIPLEQSNALFTAVTAASAALGLGSEATAGALNALGQMASKGTVSMEELRQQLGDRLPGAMGLVAKGLGITEAQLVKLVESGQLATRDFIAPFTAALNTMKGEVDGIVPSWDRFKGLLSETAQGAGDAGWTQVLNLAIKVLGGTVGIFVLGLSGLSEALFLVIKGMAAMAVAFTSPKVALELMTDAVEQSRVRLTAQAVALNNLIAPAEAAAGAATKHAAAMTESTAAAVKAISANTELSGAQRLAALSAVLAGDATLDAAAKIVQYNVAAAELLVKQQAQTDAYEKAAKAAKQHGDTIVELAKLTGNATEIQNASTEAAQLHADALAKVAASQSTETAILVGQKAELLASQAARGLTTEQIKVQADALDKLIIKSRAETDQAAQASLAAQQTLLERKLATEALKDNSAKLAEYKTALDEAKKSLELNINLEKLGLTTKAEVTAAQQDVSDATYLYRDALNDVIAKLRLDTQAKSANLLVAEAQAAARQSHYDALAREARALGDSTLATHYDIAAKQEAIQVLKLKMDLERLQNAAALVELETKRKLIDSTTDEGKAKLRAIDIEVALLKVKNTHNEAIKDQIRLIESEVTALRNGTASTGSNTSARTTNAQAIAAQTSEIDKQTAALARERAEMRALGEAMTEVYNSPAAVLLRKKNAGTLTAADLGSAQTNFDVANNNLNQVQTGQAGFMSPEAIAAREREYREAKAILEQTKSLTDGTGGSTQAGSGAAGSTAPGTTGSTTTVNINLGGRTTTVRVASQADANNLTSLLRQIEAAAGVST